MVSQSTPQIQIENFPAELQLLRQWIVWKFEDRDGKPNKTPYSLKGFRASSTDASTWASYEEAVSAYHRGGWSGIGFVFSGTDGYCGIDLDHCIDKATGELLPWAAQIVDDMNSYSEVSPSGTGIKIFIKGVKPGSKSRCEIDKAAGQHIEIYGHARYFTVTGNIWPGSPAVIADRQTELNELYAAYFPESAAPRPHKPVGEAWPDTDGRQQYQSPHWPTMAERERRCRLYTDKIPGGVETQNGSSPMLQVACETQRFALDDSAAWEIMREYAARCTPPWTDDGELKHKFDSARKKTVNEYGSRLNTPNPKVSPSPHPRPTATTGTTTDKIFAPGDPMPTAEALIEDKYTVDGVPTLVSHLGEFLRWRDGAYRPVEVDGIRAAAYDFLADAQTPDEKPFAPNARKIGDVTDALRAKRYLPASVTPPCWLAGGAARPIAAECVTFPNGILNLGTGEVMLPTPELFCRTALAFNYVPDAPEPIQWLNFLNQLWPDDIESIELLQDFFGYSLTSDMRQQKAILMVGPKRSGKGTIARILSSLIGEDNICNPTLASLGFPFGLAPLIGKTLAIIGDARIGSQTDSSIVAERLLSVIGEDSISIDRKYLSSIRIKPTVRFLILSNELPRINDASGALAGRLLTLILKESFYGREDTELFDRLRSELPGILLWAIRGWHRLRERGRFVEPQSSAEARRDLEDLASPISAFVKDCCRVGEALSIDGQELFEKWREWATDQGREHPGTSAVFFKDLRAASPRLRVRRVRDGTRRIKIYEGIGLRALDDHNE